MDKHSGFTQSRKVRKGRKAKKRLSLCVPLRLSAFARAVLIFSQLQDNVCATRGRNNTGENDIHSRRPFVNTASFGRLLFALRIKD